MNFLLTLSRSGLLFLLIFFIGTFFKITLSLVLNDGVRSYTNFGFNSFNGSTGSIVAATDAVDDARCWCCCCCCCCNCDLVRIGVVLVSDSRVCGLLLMNCCCCCWWCGGGDAESRFSCFGFIFAAVGVWVVGEDAGWSAGPGLLPKPLI